jgi:hypothetical protein
MRCAELPSDDNVQNMLGCIPQYDKLTALRMVDEKIAIGMSIGD